MNTHLPRIIPAGTPVLFTSPGLASIRDGIVVASDMAGHYRIQMTPGAYTYAKPASIVAFLPKG
jgi:hypothetical protein